MSKEGDSFKVNFLILKSFYDRNYINLIFLTKWEKITILLDSY